MSNISTLSIPGVSDLLKGSQCVLSVFEFTDLRIWSRRKGLRKGPKVKLKPESTLKIQSLSSREYKIILSDHLPTPLSLIVRVCTNFSVVGLYPGSRYSIQRL